MIDELQAQFLPQFIALARTRIARALETATNRDHGGAGTTLRELHALAGEAGLLGLADVARTVRATEEQARHLQTSRSDADSDRLIAALTELRSVIDRIESTTRQEGR